ncbi:MAG TPA: hypothetical protein VE028_02030 [Nitratidesulfovibrio sp.]|nr:hypothetical protein [Nitratidesulfovibrio sp.]
MRDISEMEFGHGCLSFILLPSVVFFTFAIISVVPPKDDAAARIISLLTFLCIIFLITFFVSRALTNRRKRLINILKNIGPCDDFYYSIRGANVFFISKDDMNMKIRIYDNISTSDIEYIHNNTTVFGYDSFLRIETQIDYTTGTTDTIFGAAIGGILFGGVGAIIGGIATKNRNIKSIKMHITSLDMKISTVHFSRNEREFITLNQHINWWVQFITALYEKNKTLHAHSGNTYLNTICEKPDESNTARGENDSQLFSIHFFGKIIEHSDSNAQKKLLKRMSASMCIPMATLLDSSEKIIKRSVPEEKAIEIGKKLKKYGIIVYLKPE